MAELLIRVTDKIDSGDVTVDCQRTKRGDVITSRPNGWGWGQHELTSPEWRVLRVTDLTDDEGAAFCASEIPADPLNPPATLLKRAFYLDIDGAAMQGVPGFSAWIADDRRATPLLALDGETNHQTVLGAKVQKPSIPDPTVIGGSTSIG